MWRACGARIGSAFCRGLIVVAVCSTPVTAAAPGGDSNGLRLPRFVSLKSDKVNVRAGPTKDHDVTWVYTRTGLPVEIVAEYENWRRIRDWEGAEGWVYHSLLSGKRTGLVVAKTKSGDDPIPVRATPDGQAAVTARLQPGVLSAVKRCTGDWCRVSGNGYDGWIEQERLWGVYPKEQVE
jgi:SH3-like domain-containing protein